jgi:outer membrane protein assembly factor BamB
MTTISRNIFADFQGRPFGDRGNILIYVLMTMVIFAVIGVTMVSLFSTSVSSSATANETRRAFYLAESGIRYAFGELRQNGFSKANINNLNTTNFKMPPSGGFDIRVFGAWFKSPTNQSVAGGALNVELEKGKIPTGFFPRLTSVVPDLYLVLASLDPRATTPKPNANEVAKVNSFTPGSDTAFQFDLADGLIVGREKRICMAVRPSADRTFTPAGDANAYLDLTQSASNIFPKSDGAFLFDSRVYFYKSAKEETGHFRLSYITPGPNVSPTNTVTVAAASDYILLAPNNFFVTSKGTTPGNVDFGGDMDHAAALASHSAADLSEPDLAVAVGDVVQIESGSSFMGEGTDTQGDYLQIGSTAGMGAVWYNQNLYLGGSTNYCTSSPDSYGRRGCFFESGMRAFFTLEYSGTGDGLIFALINGLLNQFASAGGDFEATELLGYAGDSRTNNFGGFLDTTGIKGLQPPKMGLEFDARRNWDSTFEAKPTDYCSGSSLKQNTRNDPDPASATKDFVQYVYWGNTSGVNVPCRPNPNTYDDNRHNPGASPTGDWTLPLSGVVNTSAATSPDGRTIYIASNMLDSDGKPTTGYLYAIQLDAQGYPTGWSGNAFFTGSGGVTSPVVFNNPTNPNDPYNGTIYVGSGDRLCVFRPGSPNPTHRSGSPYRLEPNTRASKPVIDVHNRKVYIAASDDAATGYIYARLLDGSPDPDWAAINYRRAVPRFFTDPVLTPDGSLIIAATDASRIYALRASNGSFDPSWTASGAFISASVRNAPGVGPGATPKGTVYVTTSDRTVYALSGEDGSELHISPVVGSVGLATQPVVADGRVYVGSNDQHLYALNSSNLSLMWAYPTPPQDPAAGPIQSAPAVDSNGTLYFGSGIITPAADNRNVYAVYWDGTEKWRYQTGSGNVRGTPSVRPDGSVYVGSSNSNFYAINQFAVPKSLKDKFITYDAGAVGGVGGVTVDSAENWLQSSTLPTPPAPPGTVRPWAVRMEVYRNTGTAPANYVSYILRTWVRQCQQASCRDVIGSYYDDTHLTYSPALRPPQMEQTINLSSTENTQFQRFIFGFTSQTASGDNQQSVIRELKLGFVRATDPTVTCDPSWPEGTICP